jgi:hypothetical protein
MRDWVGKQVARYEHGARRLQLFFWAIIAINTFIEVVWRVLPLEVVLILYFTGGVGVLVFGYVSHKAKVGRSIAKAQFDIETIEIWFGQINFGYAMLEVFHRLSDEELILALDYWSKKLKIDWRAWMKEAGIKWESETD